MIPTYDPTKAIWIDYTNHRGERRWRAIIPQDLRYGVTPHHLKPMWILYAWDVEKKDHRDFSLLDIHSMSQTKP